MRSCTHARATVDAASHIGEITDLPVSQGHFNINQEQLAGDGAKDKRIGSSGTNLADADNCDPRRWRHVSKRHF
jgi:hypothetical protein